MIINSRAHGSVIDACRLALVPTQSFSHNDLSSLQKMLEKKPYASHTLIIVDGIYSMGWP